MTDRKLLELAAKAAGIEIPEPNAWFDYHDHTGFLWLGMDGTHIEKKFNPINDDGDALRLAVELKLGISILVHKTIRTDVICFLDSSVNIREEGGNPYSATRRAIVRAAAEIGKQMGGSDD